ncbi:hypothetical protein KJY77_04925 [Canibacter sp. lx-72]|uniref:hypothetical protein n=1 Tax=Canibacter zhuwentaonis TaxID=2837491 RepID=UPI001BDC35EF|nr:hypothetical protein [Canibacter zhuwentaonis]MBT1018478.1 hypothetical protein [Canibacter zhuwentaonis]MBT1035681.1 hypothetical protein [Canibacter zhuwentaonis]
MMTGSKKSRPKLLAIASILTLALSACSSVNGDNKPDPAKSAESNSWQDTEKDQTYQRNQKRPHSLPAAALYAPADKEIYDAGERTAGSWFIVYAVPQADQADALREKLMSASGYVSDGETSTDAHGFVSAHYSKPGFTVLTVTAPDPQNAAGALLSLEIAAAAQE